MNSAEVLHLIHRQVQPMFATACRRPEPGTCQWPATWIIASTVQC